MGGASPGPESGGPSLEPEPLEPGVSEPTTGEPSAMEPSALEPSAMEPSAMEPSAMEPTSAEPETTSPAQEPCGVKYTALGNGGWQMCVRLADGGGACTASGSADFVRATFQGGGAVTGVTQITGIGDRGVMLVTESGALHLGNSVTEVQTEPVVNGGVVNVSGGFHSRVALTKTNDGFGILSWVDNGTPAEVSLPDGEKPIQVAGNYGLACALTESNNVFCWDAGSNHSLPFTAMPSQADVPPVRTVSVGQNSVCGVGLDDTLQCMAAWYDNPWLPSEGTSPDFQVRQSTFPEVRDVHAGYHQGIVVRADGAAFFLSGNGAGEDNPGTQFSGVTDVIAVGGDRGSACVQAGDGAVHCWVSGGSVRATLGGGELSAAAASCPY